jgi:hypothetical protein
MHPGQLPLSSSVPFHLLYFFCSELTAFSKVESFSPTPLFEDENRNLSRSSAFLDTTQPSILSIAQMPINASFFRCCPPLYSRTSSNCHSEERIERLLFILIRTLEVNTSFLSHMTQAEKLHSYKHFDLVKNYCLILDMLRVSLSPQ